ncbi:MAG: hypothetical protein ACRDZ0_05450 [Acidimicrobiales bacterium]
MTIHTKGFEGAAAVLLTAVTAVSLGAALGLGSGGGDKPSPVPADRPDSMVEVTPSTADDAAITRCDLLPEHYVAQEETVPSGGAGESVNAWAAGDAAVSRYLNELARLCRTARG